jgi:hypothetical protein
MMRRALQDAAAFTAAAAQASIARSGGGKQLAAASAAANARSMCTAVDALCSGWLAQLRGDAAALLALLGPDQEPGAGVDGCILADLSLTA